MTVSSFKMWPNHIVVGAGAIRTIGEHLDNYKATRVFMAVDSGIKQLSFVRDTVKDLDAKGISVELFSEIQSNPTEKTVNDGLKRIQALKGQAIVAIGGGSALDTAKGINVVYNLGGEITEYSFMKCGGDGIPHRLSPFIAIPTTAGTGSEVSGTSVLIDSKNNEEFFIDSHNLIPDVSVLDPETTVSLPPYVTAFTGMDALTHHIEAYLSNIDSDVADGLCMQGISMIAKNLRKAVSEGSNLEAREQMLIASMMGALAFMQSELGLAHALTLSLSEVARVPHGVANAMMLPKVVAFNSKERPDRVANIAKSLGVDTHGLSSEETIKNTVQELESLNSDIGIPKDLSEVGVTQEMIPVVVKGTLEYPILECNPRKVEAGDIEEILRASLKE